MNDNLSQAPNNTVPVEEPNEDILVKKVKKQKVLIISLFVLLILLICGIVYVVGFTNIFEDSDEYVTQETPISQEADEEPEETFSEGIVIETDSGEEIYLNNLPNSIEDTEYVLVSTGETKQVWEDNSEGYASTSYIIEYYHNSQDLFGDSNSETVVVDGETYVYVSKTDGEDAYGSGMGTVYNRESSKDINGYPAYELISYYNSPIDEDTSSSGDFYGVDNVSLTGISCAFKLSEISPELDGAILFTIASAAESYACEELGPDFEIEIKYPEGL
jgi:cell division protein FtsL